MKMVCDESTYWTPQPLFPVHVSDSVWTVLARPHGRHLAEAGLVCVTELDTRVRATYPCGLRNTQEGKHGG